PVLFSLAVTVGTSLDTFPETRYHLAVLPGLCLLAAGGAARVRSRAGAVAVAALVLLLPASQLPRYYRDFTRAAYDQAASVIATHRSPGELIFVGGGFRTLAYYYRGSFPRIGSPEWDRLATETASFGDRLTIASGKWGDSYAFEKIPPEIHYIGRLGGPPEVAVVGFVREAAPAGLFDGSYWLVLRIDRDEVILPAMADHGVACDSANVYTVPGLEIRHCNPGAATQTASP
ncbi:MAG TPA: hypothetical protein VLA43_06860, partial [Longimicrobiales bacterium]|nr:hypothetical protein [Longimicrobiales bacterium]